VGEGIGLETVNFFFQTPIQVLNFKPFFLR